MSISSRLFKDSGKKLINSKFVSIEYLAAQVAVGLISYAEALQELRK